MVYLNPLARLSPYISGMAVQLAMNTIDTRRISGHPLRHVLVMMLDLCAVSILLLAAFIGQKPEPAPSFMYELFGPLVVKLIVALWPPVYGWCLARVIFRVLSIEKTKDGGAAVSVEKRDPEEETVQGRFLFVCIGCILYIS